MSVRVLIRDLRDKQDLETGAKSLQLFRVAGHRANVKRKLRGHTWDNKHQNGGQKRRRTAADIG